ncbi:MAG: CHAT domain-containing protein [Acidobacteriota bacterium]|nr:CHAT domain-containing protein [Acidobacteriota bacterium]
MSLGPPVYLAVFLSAGANLLTAAEATALEPNRPLVVSLTGGEARTFQISLKTGQAVRVSAVAPEFSVDTVLSSPAGPVLHISSLSGTGGKAVLAAVADADGRYQFEVRSQSKETDARECRVNVDVLGDATDRDRTIAAAFRLFSTAKTHDVLDRAMLQAVSANDEYLRARITIAKNRLFLGSGEYVRFIDNSEAAIPLARAMDDPRFEAQLVYGIGVANLYREKYREAVPRFEQALAFQRSANQAYEIALTLHNLSISDWYLGDCQRASREVEEALAIGRRLHDRAREAFSLLALANDQLCLGDAQKALNTYAEALPLWRELKDSRNEALTLNNTGVLHASLGDFENARNAYDAALKIRRKSQDPAALAETLNNLGQLKLQSHEYRQALDYYEEAYRLTPMKEHRRGQAYALQGIGEARHKLGDGQAALEPLRRSVEILHDLGERNGESYSWQVLAKCERSVVDYRRALALEREVGNRPGEAISLAGLARLQRDGGDLEGARSSIEEALEIIESSRSNVLSPDLRIAYLAAKRDAYELYVSVLLRLDHSHADPSLKELAFQTSERSHARALLDALAETRAGIREGIDPKLLEQQRELQREWNAKAESMTRSPDARMQFTALTVRRQQLDARIREISPRYAALDAPQPASLKDIRARVLDDQTTLLEYMLGEEQSYLWVLTRNTLECIELPGRGVIDPAVRRMYAALTARNRRNPSETIVKKQARLRAADRDVTRAAALLKGLLISRIPTASPGRRFIVVPDGSLSLLPFAALGIAGQIVNAPSATVLAEMRSDSTTRSPRTGSILVIADPVFNADDVRISRPHGVHPAATDPAHRFPRLLLSRAEADSIAAMAPRARVHEALDFNATPAALKGPDAERFSVIHIAAHTLLNGAHPELSGIVLSRVDRNGNPRDGFLRLQEIYNLRLRADLVTLSACETAMGKDVRGEGLMGLARGFLYAGATRVVASLWKVDDNAAAAFMERFYGNLYRRGMSPAAALRAAQSEMRRTTEWHAPYYWSAFILQGDWR